MTVLEITLTKNINEVFDFPCVKGAYKHEEKVWYMCIFDEDVVALHEGDVLYQETDGGWHYRRDYEKDN